MKKLWVIAIMCVYFLLTLGMQLHLHYCCGELADLHLFSAEQGCDSRANEDDHCCKKGNCCSFFEIDLSVDDSHQPSEQARYTPFEIAQQLVYSLPSQISLMCMEGFSSVSHSPPPINRRYVLFGSLVLYA